MLSPEFYVFKRLQREMNQPYIYIGMFAVVVAGLAAAWLASEERSGAALIALAFSVYFLFGTVIIPTTGPVFLASRGHIEQFAKMRLEEEIRRNPALDLVYLRRLAGNEQKVRSTAAAICIALDALIEERGRA